MEALFPLVIQFFEPFRIKLSPISLTEVFCEVASEPASGSDKQKAPIILPVASFFKYFSFCSSVPYF
jgi:hypothetical protein